MEFPRIEVIAMTLIELNIAGYHVTHTSQDLAGCRGTRLHGWWDRRRKARGRRQGVEHQAA
jgi:hypothetical protein